MRSHCHLHLDGALADDIGQVLDGTDDVVLEGCTEVRLEVGNGSLLCHDGLDAKANKGNLHAKASLFRKECPGKSLHHTLMTASVQQADGMSQHLATSAEHALWEPQSQGAWHSRIV